MRFIIKELFLEIKEHFEYLKSVIPNIDDILQEIDKTLHMNTTNNEINNWLNNNESLILKLNSHITQIKY